MIYSICHGILKFYFKLFFGMKVFGLENLPKSGKFILACNHVSNLDPFVVGSACRRKLSFMAKEELFSNRFVGGFIASVGAFPIKRDGRGASVIKESIKRLKAGGGLMLFPEGRRMKAGEQGQFKLGVGMLTKLSGAPVVPAYVKGTSEALPRDAKKLKFTRLTVYFGRPISAEDIKGASDKETYELIAQVVMDTIKELEIKSKNK